MVAVVAESVAEGPEPGARKVTTPPSTGSDPLFAVTVTTSGLANVALTYADCGVLPEATASVNPWLSNAPMSTLPTRPRPRWSVVGMVTPEIDEAPASMAGLPGRRAKVWVGPPSGLTHHFFRAYAPLFPAFLRIYHVN